MCVRLVLNIKWNEMAHNSFFHCPVFSVQWSGSSIWDCWIEWRNGHMIDLLFCSHASHSTPCQKDMDIKYIKWFIYMCWNGTGQIPDWQKRWDIDQIFCWIVKITLSYYYYMKFESCFHNNKNSVKLVCLFVKWALPKRSSTSLESNMNCNGDWSPLCSYMCFKSFYAMLNFIWKKWRKTKSINWEMRTIQWRSSVYQLIAWLSITTL